ncbi:related to Protein interacting with Hsp90 1 [Nakaseomyces glabratus]|nr:PIH1 N-terminal domain [Nakaseomyces glabratus]OXB44696.1 hypothetical protein B1J91_D03916g [Nakaseomyces glabratus]OXB49995.1 hypothetical protein B1J92_D03916g [Nakaseomyces glabratus]QNG12935.1 uncharacterized protein GWK60_D04081 [Nakaseomyces glabratus]SCV13459.1 related to Protein interacting with Hsp90 1 [Nakaseomyces glabratus]
MDFLLRPIASGDDNQVTVLHPEPLFVIKSKIVNIDNRPKKLLKLEAGSKIFVNLCHDPQAPKPEIPFDPNIVYPLIINNKWEIPIVASSIRTDTDKKGQVCYVIDCCVASDCVKWFVEDYQLKEIVVEWCLEAAELREVIEISRDKISFPKMRKKGDSIPDLEIFSNELDGSDIKEATQNDKGNDPSSLLQIRRDLLSQEEDLSLSNDSDITAHGLPPLFPKANETKGRSLIQEIDDLTLKEKPKNAAKKVQKNIEYNVIMKKIENHKYKLRLDIQIDSISGKSDLNIFYDPTNNDIVLRNLNTDLYDQKDFKIPLPNIFEGKDIMNNSEIFYVSKTGTLTIFL